jgi:hypothetical protein
VHDSKRGAARAGTLNSRLGVNQGRADMDRRRKEKDAAIEREESKVE